MNTEDTYESLIWSLAKTDRVLDILTLKNMQCMPERLYRFRSNAQRSERPNDWYAVDEIRNSYLFMAPANSQNDPFDSCFTLQQDVMFERFGGWKALLQAELSKSETKVSDRDVEQVSAANSFAEAAEYLLREKDGTDSATATQMVAALEEAVNEVINRPLVGNFVQRIQSAMCICSFTDSPNREQMWGYYNNFEGVCIAYNPRSSTAPGAFLRLTLPVQYKPGGLDITEYIDSASALEEKMHRLSLLAALVKNDQWRNEQEWRYCAPFGIGPLKVDAPDIAEVIIGYKASKEYSDAVRLACEKRGIPTKVARPDMSTRTVVFEPTSAR